MTNVPTATRLPMLQTYYHGKPINYIDVKKLKELAAEATWVTTDTSWITEVPPDYSLPTKPLKCKCCGASMSSKDKCEYCDTRYI